MKEEHKKIYRTLLGFVLIALFIVCRAAYLQIINKDKLVSRYEGQTIRRAVVYPNRGAIYDRNGAPLAISLKSYTIAVTPRQFRKNSSSEEIYNKIAELVPDISVKEIKGIVKNRRSYTSLRKKVDLSQASVSILKKYANKVGGIHIDPAPTRSYPNNELLSQTIGFVGSDNKGLAGIEYQYDTELRGRATTIKYIRDNKGRTFGNTIEEPGESSKDIYLSIDKELQSIAEKAIKDAVIEHEATLGGIGVMDASTGEILAIANYPSFDLNHARKAPIELRKLPFVSDPIEPGSVFKVFTVASALEHNLATPDRSFYCEKGYYKVQGHVISEAETRKKFEWLTVKEILEHSSNIGTTKIAFDLTFPRLKATLDKFGIGQKTDIEIPGESRGIFTTQQNVTPLSLSNISFGQGVATTGIQMLAAYAAIANGGVYNYPTIIKGKKRESKRVISKKIADQLTDMLVGVVEEGTATRAKINHFVIGGKTSTAQRPSPNGGYKGYIPGFIGFPVNVDNKFVIYAYVDYPKGKSYYGSTVAIPVFRKVAEYMLYKNKRYAKFAKHQDEVSKSNKLTVNVKKTKRIFGPGLVPNYIGLDKISAINLSERFKINVHHKGMGVVSEQQPSPGSRMNSETIVKLMYQPPSYE